jgi:hypothetical protein
MRLSWLEESDRDSERKRGGLSRLLGGLILVSNAFACISRAIADPAAEPFEDFGASPNEGDIDRELRKRNRCISADGQLPMIPTRRTLHLCLCLDEADDRPDCDWETSVRLRPSLKTPCHRLMKATWCDNRERPRPAASSERKA